MSLLAVWVPGCMDGSVSRVAVWMSLLAVWLPDCTDESVSRMGAVVCG